MSDKRQVRIRLESVQSIGDSGDDTTVHEAKGDLYFKSGTCYLRYNDPGDESGQTMVTIRIDPGELKVIRRGTVESEQAFVPNREVIGHYRSPLAKFRMTSLTKTMEVWLSGPADSDRAGGAVSWIYDLYVGDELVGRFHNKLEFKEDNGNE